VNPITCPNCYTVNSASSRTCSNCQTPISAPPPQTPQQNMGIGTGVKLGIGGCIGILICMGACAACITIAGRDAMTGLKTPTSSTPPPSTSVPSASVTPANASWHTINTIKDNGTKRTETFSVRTDEWRVSWDTKPGQYGNMNFQI
jgi:hypothetical protein